MNDFDKACRYLAKRRPQGFLGWLLAPLPAAFRFRRWLDTQAVTFPGEPDRRCDTVAEYQAGPGGPLWALVVEFQSEPDPDMRERLLEYLLRLRRERRHGPGQAGKYQVAGVVLNLTGAVQPGTLEMFLPGLDRVGTFSRAEVRTLRDESAAALLEGVAGGRWERCVLPWAALMRGGDEPTLLERWRELAAAEPEAALRGDYGGLALVFAALADRASVWQEALEGWNVLLSPQVQAWREEGKAEGKAEGLVEGKRFDLLEALEVRFPGQVPEDLRAAVAAQADPAELARWFKAALTAPSLDAYRAATTPHA